MAPLAIAYEKGFFEDEGLYVTLEPQANWKVLLDRVITGELDGAHMLAGQPLGATVGFGTKADVVTAFCMDLNGNAITVSNDVWALMKPACRSDARGQARAPDRRRRAEARARQIQGRRQAVQAWAWSSPCRRTTTSCATGSPPAASTRASIRRPTSPARSSADVLLSVTPPPQMPATLEAGTINGYCVGEPWNQQAIFKGVGVPVVTDYEIWKNNPEKVFGVTEGVGADKNPHTHVALIKALIRAAIWLDANNGANRKEAAQILSRPEYVGADYRVIANT